MRLQMGSFTEITVPAADYTHRAVSRAFDAVEALDRLLSTYRPESEVSRLAAAGRLAVSPEVLEITALAIRMARATGGAFNPALGPVIQLWRDAEARQVPPSPAELARARRSTDYERVLLHALNGDASLFTGSDEIEEAWEIMDPIIQGLALPDAPLPARYAVGSKGPDEADRFLAKYGSDWQHRDWQHRS